MVSSAPNGSPFGSSSSSQSSRHWRSDSDASLSSESSSSIFDSSHSASSRLSVCESLQSTTHRTAACKEITIISGPIYNENDKEWYMDMGTNILNQLLLPLNGRHPDIMG